MLMLSRPYTYKNNCSVSFCRGVGRDLGPSPPTPLRPVSLHKSFIVQNIRVFGLVENVFVILNLSALLFSMSEVLILVGCCHAPLNDNVSPPPRHHPPHPPNEKFYMKSCTVWNIGTTEVHGTGICKVARKIWCLQRGSLFCTHTENQRGWS